METRESDQPSLCVNKRTQETLETLSPRELFSDWSILLWKESMRPLIKHLFQVELTLSEGQILRHLHACPRPLAISDVAEHLAITHSAASRTVDRLVDDGLVNRAENATDRRQKQIQLTEKGLQLLQMLNTTFSIGVERLVAGLSAQEQEQFRLLVAHMLAAYPDTAEVPQTQEPSE